MFRNYIKTAFRFIKENKLFASINALGLSISLSASFIILLFVINELSYDHCHINSRRIFRVLNYYTDTKNTISTTPFILASALKEEFPQIEKAINVMPISLSFKLNSGIINITAIGTDSEVFDMFTLPLVGRTPKKNLLEDKNSIVLSKDLAEKVFPRQDPIGKEILGLVNNEERVFSVSGVIENIPDNSTFKAQCFINSKLTVEYINQKFAITNADRCWDKDLWITWILLSKNINAKALQKQFTAFEPKKIGEKPGSQFSLQNLSNVYLGSDKILNTGIKGNIDKIRIFSAIALLIILVATINYILLSTVVSSRRTKEIAMRKTYGASINKIKYQLLSESILLAMLVLPFSLLLTWLALPYAGKLFQTQLHIISSNIIIYILVYFALTIFIGVASGIYTSTYLSRLKVLDIIKNSTFPGKQKLFFRSFLIVVELVIFCSFVSSTLVIRSQYRYEINKDLGYHNNGILLIDLGRDFKGYSAYINNIKSNPNIIMASGTKEGLPMMNNMSLMIPNFLDNKNMVEVEAMGVDNDFLNTMGIAVIRGRSFSQEFGSDLTQSAILNETAVKRLGLTDPIGKIVANLTIIGVVKDFNLHSLYSDIPPLIIIMSNRNIRQVVVHYKPGTLASILPTLETEWEKAAPDKAFHYTTIEEVIKNLYSTERNLTTIISIFSLFTLLISTFGLFGLTLFIARSRTKEIGIKKIFGSSQRSILYSFLTGNFLLVSIAWILSIPITLHFIMNWLNKFAYKVNINWLVFVAAYIVAAIVVLLTVFFHAYKASCSNPIKALRYE